MFRRRGARGDPRQNAQVAVIVRHFEKGTVFRRALRPRGMNPTEPCPQPPQSRDLTAQAEWIEQQALIDLLGARTHGAPDPQVARLPGVCSIATETSGSLLVNRVFVHPQQPEARASLRCAIARLRERRIGRVLVHVPRHACDAALAAELADLGLVRYPRSWVKLGLALEATTPQPEPDPLEECREIEAGDFAQLIVQNHQLEPSVAAHIASAVRRPGWHVFVVHADGGLAAGAALFARGEVGYLGFAATRPAARGCGLQRRLIARRIRVAQALGCRFVVAETGLPIRDEPNPSLANLQAAGLRPLEVRDNYVFAGTAWG